MKVIIREDVSKSSIWAAHYIAKKINEKAARTDEPFVIEPGERIAQLVVAKHEHVDWEEVEVLDETERGEGGFGSTGVK
jgi:hypothetical protein